MTTDIGWEIRNIDHRDLDQLAVLDRDAFNSWAIPNGNELSRRYPDDLEALLRRDPGGAFCAEAPSGELLGYVFCRSWGRWGWFGPLGCSPSWQGRGIGTSLVKRAVEYLRVRTDVFGLETMGNNYANLLLYARLGFRAVAPTILLRVEGRGEGHGVSRDERPPVSATNGYRPVVWDDLAAADRARALDGLHVLFRRLAPGLDYTKELLLAHELRTGQTAIWRDEGDVTGFAHVRTRGHRVDDPKRRAEVELFGFAPGTLPGVTMARLSALVQFLVEAGNREVVVWAPMGCGETLSAALGLLVEPVRTRQRMIHRTSLSQYLAACRLGAQEEHVHGSTWAG